MDKDQKKFVRDMETVSSTLAAWVQNCFSNGWSVEDVKVHIKAAAKVCGKEI